jgi:hypothetical protein
MVSDQQGGVLCIQLSWLRSNRCCEETKGMDSLFFFLSLWRLMFATKTWVVHTMQINFELCLG